ncbi:MAG: hypothetical protein A2252_09020 [Elusimicrobia bacterium RIFOXYA2_FULL_39_19]|nr:MAG: hypothetical protein A2252_09020 [Elusimicrobia bacterium RIFOXYA2_FULL_39_19]
MKNALKYLILALIVTTIQGFAFTQTFKVTKEQKISTLERTFLQESVVTSTDNRHFAYVAGSGQNMYVMRDLKSYFSYPYIKTDSLVFSPDGNHLAYIAGQSSGSWFVVVDNVRKSPRNMDDIVSESLTFSPDSKRLAYLGSFMNRWFCTVDEREGTPMNDIRTDSLIFSPDSKHLAYMAKDFNKWFVVIDNNKGNEYDYIPPWSKISWLTSNKLSYILIDISNDIYVIEESLKVK